MLTETFVDKRLFERLPCSLVGKYESSDGSSGEVRCQNISALGVKVTLSKSLIIGSSLRISFAAKRQMLFSVEGNIRWCRKNSLAWNVGVTFHKPLFFPMGLVV
ncbi:MAG: PilZ domain-containing protein [Candidatus Omnitrophota bacterium]|nr:PilZ domain-containing protein [Candidatus Omnitrophota bacterium]